ncbi:MAG TPA: tripartite tricarboxylate transporter substrate binding protein [Burkholderiales bacterium]|nr:tripartite tricarboxylate transporter substrate binding protein [Burkholderiales bacterium]
MVAANAVLAAGFPSRPVTLIVPWGAGGGTDAVARMLASLLEKDFGQPVNVVNRTGGSGVVGHQAIATAAPDGYTFGLITFEITQMHHQGLTQLNGASFTPIGLINVDPAAIQVNADSPYKTLPDLLDAIRKNPGKLKAAGTARGGSWHLSLYGMLADLKIDPASVPWVPSVSNAAGLQELAAGGVDIVSGSHPEARALIEAGRVRSLAIMDEAPSQLFPRVPTLKAAAGSKWLSGVWRGIAAPKNLPKAIEERLIAAVKQAYDSKEYREFMTGRGFGMRYLPPQEFAALMAKTDAENGVLMKKFGMTQ